MRTKVSWTSITDVHFPGTRLYFATSLDWRYRSVYESGDDVTVLKKLMSTYISQISQTGSK